MLPVCLNKRRNKVGLPAAPIRSAFGTIATCRLVHNVRFRGTAKIGLSDRHGRKSILCRDLALADRQLRSGKCGSGPSPKNFYRIYLTTNRTLTTHLPIFGGDLEWPRSDQVLRPPLACLHRRRPERPSHVQGSGPPLTPGELRKDPRPRRVAGD
jgi:hypothetical protein